MFSTHPNAPPILSSPSQRGEGESLPTIAVVTPSSPSLVVGTVSSPLNTSLHDSQDDQGSDSPSGSTISPANQHGNSLNDSQSSPNSRDRVGPSDFQSLFESIKSLLNAVSIRWGMATLSSHDLLFGFLNVHQFMYLLRFTSAVVSNSKQVIAKREYICGALSNYCNFGLQHIGARDQVCMKEKQHHLISLSDA